MANILEQMEQLRADRDAKKAAWDHEREHSLQGMKKDVESAQVEVEEAEAEMRRSQQSRQVISDVQAAMEADIHAVEQCRSGASVGASGQAPASAAVLADSHQDKEDG